MSIKWNNFSMTLHNLTHEQALEVEFRMLRLQEELEDKFDTTGGDFIGIDEEEFKSR